MYWKNEYTIGYRLECQACGILQGQAICIFLWGKSSTIGLAKNIAYSIGHPISYEVDIIHHFFAPAFLKTTSRQSTVYLQSITHAHTKACKCHFPIQSLGLLHIQLDIQLVMKWILSTTFSQILVFEDHWNQPNTGSRWHNWLKTGDI